MAIVSKFYDGPVTEADWAANRFGGASYGVNGADDWKVTATTGDRTVSIAAGSGFGHGVSDISDANVTLQLDPITSGSRWDLIAMRRDWQPAAGGPSAFVKVAGASSKAIPATRLKTPGVQDDQPVALVQVTAGQTQPTAIVDLRCWASNGGVVAVDAVALDYLAKPGASVRIGPDQWDYLPDANNLFGWQRSAGAGIRASGKLDVTTTASAPYQARTISLPAGFTLPPNVQLTWEAGNNLPARLRTYTVTSSSFGVNVMADPTSTPISGTVHWVATQG